MCNLQGIFRNYFSFIFPYYHNHCALSLGDKPQVSSVSAKWLVVPVQCHKRSLCEDGRGRGGVEEGQEEGIQKLFDQVFVSQRCHSYSTAFTIHNNICFSFTLLPYTFHIHRLVPNCLDSFLYMHTLVGRLAGHKSFYGSK